MSYCINCGSQLQPGAKFCSACGTAVAGAVRPARTRVPALDYVRDGLAGLALIVSLFTVWHTAGTGRLTGEIAATQLDVVLVTLLSLASLGIPYLWRAGVFGPNWGYRNTQDARLIANAPYFLLVVIYLIIEIVAHPGLGPAMAFGLAGAVLAAQPRESELAEDDVARDRRWIGAVLAIAGLVVVLTLVQIIEAAALFDAASMVMIALLALGNAALLAVVALGVARHSAGWRLVGIGIGVTGAIIGLLSLSSQFILTKLTTTALFPSFSFVFWAAFGAAVAAPSVGRLMERRHPGPAGLAALRPVIDLAIGVNALMALVSIIALIRVTTPGEHFLGAVSPVPFVLALIFGIIGVLGGIVVRQRGAGDHRQGHILATGYAGVLFVLGLVLVVVWSVLGLGSIAPLTLLLAFAFPAALALILWGTPAVRAQFASLPAGERSVRYSFAGGQRPKERIRQDEHRHDEPPHVVPPHEMPEHGLPDHTGTRQDEPVVQENRSDLSEVYEAIGLAEPAPAGEPGARAGDADAGASADVPREPAEPAGATAVLPDLTQRLKAAPRATKSRERAPEGSLEAIRAEAANRRTSALRLREIASTVPEARAAVASNPKAYPDLLTWLANLGDPDVDAALERRKR